MTGGLLARLVFDQSNSQGKPEEPNGGECKIALKRVILLSY